MAKATRADTTPVLRSTSCDDLRQCIREAAVELGVDWLRRFMAASGVSEINKISPVQLAAILAFLG